MEQVSDEKRWHPFDFGFYRDVAREDVFYNGYYELRRFKDDMWLLRRRKKDFDGKTVYMVKAYYQILQTDYAFADMLFNKRLNKFDYTKDNGSNKEK